MPNPDLSTPAELTEGKAIETTSSELVASEVFTEFENDEGAGDFEVIPMAEVESGQLSNFSEADEDASLNNALKGEENAEKVSSENSEIPTPKVSDAADIEIVSLEQETVIELITAVEPTDSKVAVEDECFVPADEPVVTEAGSPKVLEGIPKEESPAENPSDVGQTEVQSESQPEVTVEPDILPEEVDLTLHEKIKGDAELYSPENTVVQDTLDSSAQEAQEQLSDNKNVIEDENFASSEKPMVSEDDHTIVTKVITEEVLVPAEEIPDSHDVEGSYTPEETVGEQIDTATQADTVESESSTSPDLIAENKGDTDTHDDSTTTSEALKHEKVISSVVEEKLVMGTLENGHELTEDTVKVQVVIPKEMILSPSNVGKSPEVGGAPVIKDTTEEKISSSTGLSVEESTQLLINLQTACTKILEDLSMFTIESINVKISSRQSTIHLLIEFGLCTNNVAKCGNGTSKISKQNDESQTGDEEVQIPESLSNNIPTVVSLSTETFFIHAWKSGQSSFHFRYSSTFRFVISNNLINLYHTNPLRNIIL